MPADPERATHKADGERARQRGPPAYHAGMDPTTDPAAALATAIRPLPKAELHQHLDGSLRPQTAVELATEAGIPLDVEQARIRLVGPKRCRDQAELLAFFDLPIALLQTAAALRRVTAELVEAFVDDGVRYGEIRWAPRMHLDGGLSVQEVIEAVAGGIREAADRRGSSTPLVGLIVTAMRSHPPLANVELARVAGAFGPPVVGFDLAGPEGTFPAPPHAAAFRAAREAGLWLTAHAGEVPGPERVREALDFGVDRIAHGVTAAEDPEIVALLRARGVTLDLCPTSNVQSGIVPDLAAHPLADLHRAGVSVTISTDDRTVTNTNLTDEMVRTATTLALAPNELAAIAVNGFRRAFAPRAVIGPLMADAEQAWGAWASSAGASVLTC